MLQSLLGRDFHRVMIPMYDDPLFMELVNEYKAVFSGSLNEMLQYRFFPYFLDPFLAVRLLNRQRSSTNCIRTLVAFELDAHAIFFLKKVY